MLVVILGHALVMLTGAMDLSLQSVRTFFRKNMETCLEWLSHVRGHIVSIAIHAGMPAVAIRHGFAALKDLVKLHVRLLCVHVSLMCSWHRQDKYLLVQPQREFMPYS